MTNLKWIEILADLAKLNFRFVLFSVIAAKWFLLCPRPFCRFRKEMDTYNCLCLLVYVAVCKKTEILARIFFRSSQQLGSDLMETVAYIIYGSWQYCSHSCVCRWMFNARQNLFEQVFYEAIPHDRRIISSVWWQRIKIYSTYEIVCE